MGYPRKYGINPRLYKNINFFSSELKKKKKTIILGNLGDNCLLFEEYWT